MPFSTYRGLAPSEYGMVSSASSQGREHGQADEQGPDADHRVAAQYQPREDADDPGGEERCPADREPGEYRPHRRLLLAALSMYVLGTARARREPVRKVLPAGQRQALDDPGEHLLWALASDDRLRRGQQPVREHRSGQRLHIIGDHEVAVLERGEGSAGPQQVERGPW